MKLNDSVQLAITNHNLADVYDSLGILDSALHYLRIGTSINLMNLEVERAMMAAEISEKYESDKKDALIETQKIEDGLKSRTIWLSFIGIALVVVVAILIFRNHYLEARANKTLQSLNQEIRKLNEDLAASNNLKSKLFAVIGHDIRGPVGTAYIALQSAIFKYNNTKTEIFSKPLRDYGKIVQGAGLHHS